MLTCKETSQLISQSHERRLTFSERLGLRIHLFVCGACSEFRHQMKLLHEAARRIAEERETAGVAAPLPAAARERIRERLARAGETQ
jgi:hypothetical protein